MKSHFNDCHSISFKANVVCSLSIEDDNGHLLLLSLYFFNENPQSYILFYVDETHIYLLFVYGRKSDKYLRT